ncbi:MAG: thiamine biosynthesis protein ApbE [Chloroflexi bacterium RBG_16_56_11]|nr:MAG: thiamine biosynthesis protein ApbE [Chloroflexi bacterium RBG_16_56_11]
MKKDEYQPRTYRQWVEGRDLVAFAVTVKETDLYVQAGTDLRRKTRRIVLKYRRQLESYIERHPLFLTSLEPLPVTEDAPTIARQMLAAGEQAGVGPMAAVAGAMAECVGRELLDFSPEVIVENGGDIFLRTLKKRTVGIYAGDSPLSGKMGIVIDAADTPLGICTSSGTVGHSLSFGRADAVVVLAGSAALADAAATAIGNRVKRPGDIAAAIELGRGIGGLKGLVIIIGNEVGAWGDVKLGETSPGRA